MKNNKKAWIRIVEAFVAVLLIAGVLLIVINKGYIGREDHSEKIYAAELSVLREIQTNDIFRGYILKANRTNSNPLPINWKDFTNASPHEGLEDIKNKIINRIPNYLDCEAKICAINETCILIKDFEKEIYARSIAMIANLGVFNPRQLKLFCWIK